MKRKDNVHYVLKNPPSFCQENNIYQLFHYFIFYLKAPSTNTVKERPSIWKVLQVVNLQHNTIFYKTAMQQKNSKITQLLIVQFYDKKITLGERSYFWKRGQREEKRGKSFTSCSQLINTPKSFQGLAIVSPSPLEHQYHTSIFASLVNSGLHNCQKPYDCL